MDKRVWQWKRSVGSQEFLISTAKELLPHSFVQEAFADNAMFWAKPMSAENLKTMLDNSCTLGLYRVKSDGSQTPVGMARMVTDFATLAYLTDVYLKDDTRGLGLGKWVIHCCREIALDVPDLRFMLLLTGSEQAQQWYRRECGMERFGDEHALAAMGARRPALETSTRRTKLAEAIAASKHQSTDAAA
ncbi:acetyltransferase [Macroventuria anomochaeta]|uniref:Acetyltransferase n=1 Tax=Macroventuria anomochaeta TaxID=301207 RepID=A0ACB6RNJ5_9PLEO|nr:acetyltransferase [Macroventuria anomochaeta]KAF2623501.1 acetyltransferase [Macroventuria anomochaeta]